MIAKTTGNLIGANAATEVIRTPMKVFKEARARGDTETMKRAMGYVNSFNDDAWEYKKKADESLKEEAVQAKEKEKLEKEELANRIKEKAEETDKALGEASKNPDAENDAKKTESNPQHAETEEGSENTENEDNVNAPVTYTKTGEIVGMNTEFEVSISV